MTGPSEEHRALSKAEKQLVLRWIELGTGERYSSLAAVPRTAFIHHRVSMHPDHTEGRMRAEAGGVAPTAQQVTAQRLLNTEVYLVRSGLLERAAVEGARKRKRSGNA